MEREKVLELTPDELFEKYTLAEISRIRNVFVGEIRNLRNRLREIIGDNYEDFIVATEKTNDLREIIFDINDGIQRISNDYNSLTNLQSTDNITGEKVFSDAKRAEYTAGVLIKLLIDVTEQIWSSIDEAEYVTAVVLLQLTGHVKTVLEMDLTIRLREIFPVLYEQWNTILYFPIILTEHIGKHLSTSLITPQESSKSLCSLTILENLTADNVLQRFLLLRSEALECAFKNTHGMKQTVKFHISESLQVIHSTLQVVYYCFMESSFGRDGIFFQELHKTVGKHTQPVMRLVQCDYTFLSAKVYIPSIVQEFRVLLNQNILEPIKSITVCQQVAEWLSLVKECVSNEAAPLFNVISTLKALQTIKDSCKNPVEDWHIITNCLRLPLNFSLWKELYQPLMINRAKELISDHWNMTYEILRKDVEYMIHTINNCKSDKSELNLHSYLWEDTDAEKSTLDNEIQKNDLKIKAEGISPNAAAIAEVIEKHSSSLMKDLSDMCLDEGLENKETDIIINKHQRECSYKFLTRMIEYIRNITSKDGVTESSCAFLARLLSAVATLSPSLKQSLLADGKGIKWLDIHSLFKRECEFVWKRWISLIIDSITVDIKFDLHHSDKIVHQIKNIPKWEAATVEDENENGDKIQSVVKVPVHTSFALQRFLYKLNSVCACVLPPRVIIDELVLQSVTNILFYYDECCKLKCPQVIYIQFMFDIMYIISLLVPVDNKELLSRCQQTVSQLEEKIDPFDFDAISIRLMDNVKSHTFRTKALYGIIATSKVHLTGPVTSSNISQSEDPSISYTGSQNIPWFPLLPIISTVGVDVPPNITLNDYIRNFTNLKGTKSMCQEGGCGSCIVAIKKMHPVKKKDVIFSVNSCLVPIFSCYGWSIITVEGIGNKSSGYHKVQATLAGFNGTQCGYCSPGMVMNMYSLIANKGGKISMSDVENSFGGNICRCTGYRPILDAFKSLAFDAPSSLKQKCADIEDLAKKICPKTSKICNGKCHGEVDITCLNHLYDFPRVDIPNESFCMKSENDTQWYRVTSIKEINEVFELVQEKKSTYMLLAGHTSHGVYRIKNIDIYIDINGVTELQTYVLNSDNLVLGANMSLNDTIDLFNTISTDHPDKFSYLRLLAEHIDLIANVPVRNTGTLAGNLSIKHDDKDFPSDLFLILEAVSAQLTIGHLSGITNSYYLQEYLELDMNVRVIHNITLPAYNSSDYIFRSFKIMKRAQNTHAYVNAAFLIKADKNQKFKILEKPSVVFGGINQTFIHATQTEDYLNGKSILDDSVLKEACAKLSSEIKPNEHPPEASPSYRHILAVSLFYKFVLGLSPESINKRHKSGGTILSRPLSSGKQDFETNKSVWPLTKPMPKLEAVIQCSGEAEYVNDIPTFPNELHASFVLADKGPGTIESIDTSQAMTMPGVVQFLSAKDIPGKNSFVEVSKFEDEELFAEKEIKCSGQTVGVIIAKSQAIANEAAEKVKVNIKMTGQPVTDFVEVVNKGDKSRIKLEKVKAAKKRKSDVKYKINGTFVMKGQYHFTMETQTCLCVPSEDGIDVYPSSQWITAMQVNISAALALPQNSINVRVRRIGGGYGSKLGRSALIATACAVAANNQKVPVRMVMPMETNMRAVGKRFPCYAKYEVGVDEKGVIQYLNVDMNTDSGYKYNDKLEGGIISQMEDLYNNTNWNIKELSVRTNLVSNTYCRSPGSTEGIATIEHVMEHIAAVTNQDPVAVRLANLKPESKVIPSMIKDITEKSDFVSRKQAVQSFNQENRWKKRGIALVPMSYVFNFWGTYHIILSVFAPDGTIAITHGGIEMGQGINTKVAQVCAYSLGVDINLIKIKSTNVLTAPNDSPAGGCMASDGVCYATIQCCKILQERLKPFRGRSRNKPWLDVIKEAAEKEVDLCCEFMYSSTKASDVESFSVFGTTISEVEIDLLTGQIQIVRVDLVEDAGQSMSPEVDIGQVEGAFVMGLGYWLTEELIYNKSTGTLLTDRTWLYTPPGAKDIPIDFRVYFRRDAPNPFGVLRSKATGEPPLCMSVCIVFAIRNALESARKDAGDTENWFQINLPYTPENIMLSSLTKVDQFSL